MKRSRILYSLPAACLLVVLAAQADDAALLEETRTVAAAMPPKLMAVLSEEIAKGGVESAIAVCRDKAPQMASEASAKTGWNIRRVSLKNRNPKAVPDAWEAAMLAEFDALAAAGTSPATLERAAIVEEDGNRIYRYMKALPTQAMCLNCHGVDADIPPTVRAKIQPLYPDDKATGYTVGQVRGAITIKRPLP
jgi:hypothetical protein